MVATIEELRLYAKEGDSPSEILNLQRLLAVAVARVDRYAPDAPQIDKDQGCLSLRSVHEQSAKRLRWSLLRQCVALLRGGRVA